jgi:hypothetical protein
VQALKTHDYQKIGPNLIKDTTSGWYFDVPPGFKDAARPNAYLGQEFTSKHTIRDTPHHKHNLKLLKGVEDGTITPDGKGFKLKTDKTIDEAIKFEVDFLTRGKTIIQNTDTFRSYFVKKGGEPIGCVEWGYTRTFSSAGLKVEISDPVWLPYNATDTVWKTIKPKDAE